MISYPQFQPSPIRIGHHSSIDRPFFHNEQSIGLNRKELSATSPRWRYSASQTATCRLILDGSIAARMSAGFKGGVTTADESDANTEAAAGAEAEGGS